MSERSIVRSAGEPAYRFLATVIHGVNSVFCRRDWREQGRVPASGGVLVVANHNSNYDPLVLGEYLIWSGRWPRFLGKSEIWQVPVVGYFARACRQIPVKRNTRQAADSLDIAREALAAGEMVAIYPEGTITADPAEWPMVARSGAARLALSTHVPVVPVATWGGNHIIPGKKLHFPRFLPRKTLRAVAGEPVPLEDLYEMADQRAAVRIASVRIMDAITELLEELRGESAPLDRYDMRAKARVSVDRSQSNTPHAIAQHGNEA